MDLISQHPILVVVVAFFAYRWWSNRKPPASPPAVSVGGVIADTAAAFARKHFPTWLQFIAVPLANLLEEIILARIGPLVNREVQAVMAERDANAKAAAAMVK